MIWFRLEPAETFQAIQDSVRPGRNDMRDLCDRNWPSIEVPIDEATLFQSQLSQQGPDYRALHRWPLSHPNQRESADPRRRNGRDRHICSVRPADQELFGVDPKD